MIVGFLVRQLVWSVDISDTTVAGSFTPGPHTNVPVSLFKMPADLRISQIVERSPVRSLSLATPTIYTTFGAGTTCGRFEREPFVLILQASDIDYNLKHTNNTIRNLL